MSAAVVLDASAAVEILLGTNKGAALRAAFPPQAIEWVPEVFFVEVAAVLRRAELGGHITAARAMAALSRLLVAPFQRAQVKPLLREAWSLRHNVIVPDALYVVLARHLRAPLITADIKLATAPNLGITILQP